MSDDLVKQLREYEWAHRVIKEAADRIEQLEKEVKRLEQQVKMASRLLCRSQPEYAPEIGVPHLKED